MKRCSMHFWEINYSNHCAKCLWPFSPALFFPLFFLLSSWWFTSLQKYTTGHCRNFYRGTLDVQFTEKTLCCLQEIRFPLLILNPNDFSKSSQCPILLSLCVCVCELTHCNSQMCLIGWELPQDLRIIPSSMLIDIWSLSSKCAKKYTISKHLS